MEIVLDDLIIPAFRDVVTDIVECNVDEVALKGGRASTKSQCAGFSIIMGVMSSHESAICLVKYATGIENRLVNTLKFCIQLLGVEQYWKLRRSPLEYVLLNNDGKETDISIKFAGCDNVDTLKSIKSRKGGGFRYLWIEECVDFKNEKEISNLEQTFLRGTGKHVIILTYNPPMSRSHWLNKKYNYPIGKCLGYDTDIYRETFEFNMQGKKYQKRLLVHHSSYLDVVEAGHEDWLGNILVNALEAKENNTKFYRWQYLGECIGTEANVFWNISDWTYEADKDYPVTLRGLDCSNGGNDIWAYVEVWFDKKNNDLYILDEKKLSGKASLEQVAEIIKEKAGRRDIFIDSAVPTFGRQLNMKGLNCLPVRKGKDSVGIGILWLQSLNHIFVDKRRCPNVYKELTEYEYKLDKNDDVTSDLIDKDNHFIDSIRYACSQIIRHGNV